MGDRRDERRDEGHHEGGQRGPSQAGPPESGWLDLEISKVLYGRAEALVRPAAEELLMEAIKERLRERLGPRIAAIAAIAADQLADDFEANLEIEARIAARREARRATEGRVGAVFGPRRVEGPVTPQGGPQGAPADTSGGAPPGEGWDPRKA